MTDDKTKEPRTPGYFGRLIDELKSRGLPIPAALIGEAKPLALSTRQDLEPWGELHGYDEDALRLLNRAIEVHVRSAAYRQALSTDLSERVDLDGVVTGPVSESDRHSAALGLHTKELRDAARRSEKATERPPAPSPASASTARTTSAKSPIVRLNALSGVGR